MKDKELPKTLNDLKETMAQYSYRQDLLKQAELNLAGAQAMLKSREVEYDSAKAQLETEERKVRAVISKLDEVK